MEPILRVFKGKMHLPIYLLNRYCIYIYICIRVTVGTDVPIQFNQFQPNNNNIPC